MIDAQRLYYKYEYLVKRVAFAAYDLGSPFDMDELKSLARFGLLQACSKGTDRKGFASYARLRMRGEIVDEARRAPEWMRAKRDPETGRIGRRIGTTLHFGSINSFTEEYDPLMREAFRDAPDAYDVLRKREMWALLRKAKARLTEIQKYAVESHYWFHLELKEIGILLDVSESRICQILKAARERLRIFLQASKTELENI